METSVALLGQTAAIASTTLITANATALFLLATYMVCSSSGYVGDNAGLIVTWTDETTTTQTFLDSTLELDTLGNLVNYAVQAILAVNGSTVYYSTSYNAQFSPAYDLFIHLKQLT